MVHVPCLSSVAASCTLQRLKVNHSFTKVSEQTHMLERDIYETTHAMMAKVFRVNSLLIYHLCQLHNSHFIDLTAPHSG